MKARERFRCVFPTENGARYVYFITYHQAEIALNSSHVDGMIEKRQGSNTWVPAPIPTLKHKEETK